MTRCKSCLESMVARKELQCCTSGGSRKYYQSPCCEDWSKKRAMGRTGYTCIRHVFCSLNVLIWLCACGILGAGLWLRLAYSGYMTLMPYYSFASADSLLLAAGCLTFVIAFFGCCGAWFQSRCMLITYFGLVMLMFLAEFMLGTLAFTFRAHLSRSLQHELLFGIEKHYNVASNSTKEPGTIPVIWDHIHTEFHCCGVRDYTDWFHIDAWPKESRVPDSCCIQRTRYCGRADPEGLNKENWYKEGCVSAIQMWLVTRLHVVGTVGLIVAFLQLFGQVASMILFCTVRHKRSSHTYKSYDTTNT